MSSEGVRNIDETDSAQGMPTAGGSNHAVRDAMNTMAAAARRIIGKNWLLFRMLREPAVFQHVCDLDHALLDNVEETVYGFVPAMLKTRLVLGGTCVYGFVVRVAAALGIPMAAACLELVPAATTVWTPPPAVHVKMPPAGDGDDGSGGGAGQVPFLLTNAVYTRITECLLFMRMSAPIQAPYITLPTLAFSTSEGVASGAELADLVERVLRAHVTYGAYLNASTAGSTRHVAPFTESMRVADRLYYELRLLLCSRTVRCAGRLVEVLYLNRTQRVMQHRLFLTQCGVRDTPRR